MSNLNYKSSGLPHRTSRTQAIAHGAKVPATPQEPSGYCAAHGMPADTCKTDEVDAAASEVSRSGGTAKLPVNISPIRLGGK